MAVIYGTTGSDTKNGTSGKDTIYGWIKGDNVSSPSGNDKLYGKAGNDKLYGGIGSDRLDGGLGIDSLYGGKGDDTYIVDSTADRIIEYFNEAAYFDKEEKYIYDLDADSVVSSVSYTLRANLENLTLTGSSGIIGTGNALENSIIGNAANNSLYGKAGFDTLDGGLGIDTLIGGTDNDTYIVDSTTDSIVEYINEGFDRVKSSVSYTLADNLEYLKLTGSSNTTGIGNALNNDIDGNEAKNILSGGGGDDNINGYEANDTLYGCGGDDTLDGDFFIYKFGNDYLNGGYGDDDLRGSEGDDSLVGGGGNDSVNGGSGIDTLTGNAGADRFYFYFPYQGVDKITDFSAADDTIVVTDDLGGGLTTDAVITPAQFTIGSAAGDASDKFIYNQNTGALFFDNDGIGATEQVKIALLSTGLAMTNADIFVT